VTSLRRLGRRTLDERAHALHDEVASLPEGEDREARLAEMHAHRREQERRLMAEVEAARAAGLPDPLLEPTPIEQVPEHLRSLVEGGGHEAEREGPEEEGGRAAE
jgi:hypothetical protein